MKRRMDPHPMLTTALVLTALLMSGCSSDEPTGPAPSQITGSLVGHSDCVLWDGPGIPLNQTAVVWEYDGKGNLALHHLNGGFNCCPNISCEITVEGNNITVREIDEGMCDCYCLIDADFRITGLSSGIYNIKFEEPYLWEGEEKLEFSAILTASPSSDTVFVNRDHYPWMPVDEEPTGVLKELSDCGGFDDERFGYYPLADSTCILWNYDENTLSLRHLNAFFNCCVDYIQVQITINENSILIWESEVAPNPCLCICPYDIDMEIYNLSPDVYTMVIMAPDCTEFWATLDLINHPEGSECFYPILIEPWDQ